MGAAQGAGARAGNGLALLDVQAATRFALDECGRILHEAAPDLGPAPRLWLAASDEGTALRLRVDVSEEAARAAAALAAERGVDCLAELAALLDGEPRRGLTYVFDDLPQPGGGVVLSGTPQAERLLANGLPASLAALGFRGEHDLWSPWCAVLDGDDPVSVAFSARLSPVGVEAGVVTAPAARGRGFAAVATAGWASSPALGSRVRFYSTSAENVSSQRVAERLGLRLVGPSVEIA